MKKITKSEVMLELQYLRSLVQQAEKALTASDQVKAKEIAEDIKDTVKILSDWAAQ